MESEDTTTDTAETTAPPATEPVSGEARTTQRDLPCDLSPEQLIAYGEEMAKAELEIGRVEDERDNLNKIIKGLRGRRLELATMIDSGTEQRTIECRIEESLAENVIRIFRCDTGEKIEERALDGGERQASLFAARDNGGGGGMAPGERRGPPSEAAAVQEGDADNMEGFDELPGRPAGDHDDDDEAWPDELDS